MLHESDAPALADRFGLGAAAGLTGPVAQGRVGEIWRLDTVRDGERAAWAVKLWREPPDPDEVVADTAHQEHFLAAGVPMPAPVRTVDGEVLAEVGGTPVRVHTWVDVLPEDRRLDPAAVGVLLAHLHRVAPAAHEPVHPWFTEPVGADGWAAVVDDLRVAGAPFAGRLAALVPDVLVAEALITDPRDLVVCHRDLWADNLRATPGGGLVVLDWEGAGAGDPHQELGLVAFEYGGNDPGRWRALVDAYTAAGGPGRLAAPGDLSMLLAVQGHIVREGCRRWVAAETDADRADNEAWVAEFLDDPVTAATVEALLEAVHPRAT